MSSFTERPSLTAHRLGPFTRHQPSAGTNQLLLNATCGVCGVFGTVSAFGDPAADAAPLLAAHVALVGSLMHLPDLPNVCLACGNGFDRRTWCPRHIRLDLYGAVRRHADAGDMRRLHAAWVRVEDEYAQDADAIAQEDFGGDYARIHEAVLEADRLAPSLEAAIETAHRERLAARHAWDPHFDGDTYTDGEGQTMLVETQSTMWGTDA